MFSMNGTESAPRAGSIAKRLTVWYALLSVALIASSGGVLYWVAVNQLRQEDDKLLAGKIAEMRAVLLLHRNDYVALREEVEHEGTTFRGIYLRVLDARGEVIAESSAPNTQAVHDTPFSAVPWKSYGLGQDWTAGDGKKYRIMSSTFLADTRFTLHAAMDLSSEEQLLAAYWRTLSLVIVAALAIAIAMGYIIARKGMKPVSRLASIVGGLSAEGLHRRVSEEYWPVELRPLAAKFDGLLSRLEDSFGRLSRFSADIAHELRTPLHILRGEAEIVLTKGESKDDYRACIESATEEYERLSRMVDALLFLARSEQPSAQIDKQPLDLDQEIAIVCAFFQAMADEQRVAIAARGAGRVMADSGMLRRALGNLVANALSHTADGGKVSVETNKMPNGTVEICISDTGCGIAPENLPHIFDRFYCIDGARQRKGQGAGLGLAIVRTIMQLHGGGVSVQSELGRGTTFTLTFPDTTGIE